MPGCAAEETRPDVLVAREHSCGSNSSNIKTVDLGAQRHRRRLVDGAVACTLHGICPSGISNQARHTRLMHGTPA
ncbi:hypothetical protein ACCO45_008542 [Purpureocillium lilacinum]|uniref:Uncharacterized protein n=1 Tax=Purpureocillium lilacinum TaxID=33203 RepID=A0ACC4DNU6_PURLI